MKVWGLLLECIGILECGQVSTGFQYLQVSKQVLFVDSRCQGSLDENAWGCREIVLILGSLYVNGKHYNLVTNLGQLSTKQHNIWRDMKGSNASRRLSKRFSKGRLEEQRGCPAMVQVMAEPSWL